MTGADVIWSARSMVGVPFHHDGRNRQCGLDCAGLLVCIRQDLRLPPCDVRGYSKTPDPSLVRKTLEQVADPSESKPGCIWLMWLDRGTRFPQHYGVWTGSTIIHARMDLGKVIEEPDGLWVRRIAGVYWLRGVQ